MTVASLQNDSSVGAFKPQRQGAGEGFPIAAAPLYLDVYVLFVSCFTGHNYGTGLGLLSRVIGYFQENPVLDAAAAPDLPDQLDKLAIDYVGLDFAASGNLATLMGLKGQPFAAYRLRRLPFDGPAISGVAPAVRKTPLPVLDHRG